MRIVLLVPPIKAAWAKMHLRASDYIIAVDQALDLYPDITIQHAIGDFDSLHNQKKRQYVSTTKLPQQKDMTDTRYALAFAQKNYPQANIVIIGGVGGMRPEHFIANLQLFKVCESLKIYHEYGVIDYLKEGTYLLDATTKNISFFAYPKAEISLLGVKYPLNHYLVSWDDSLCISNQVITSNARITIHQGGVLRFNSLT